MPDLSPVIAAAEALRAAGRPVAVALDGMAAAGKTTAAQALAARWGAPVVHMDDFFLPPELRTPTRYAEPGGNVHYERFAAEVLPGLRAGTSFSYRVFDCSVMDYRGQIAVPAAPIVLVEGSYALHPRFGQYADVTVFCAVDPAEQERRIRARNGPDGWDSFRDRWIPMENAYHAAFRIRENADIVLL